MKSTKCFSPLLTAEVSFAEVNKADEWFYINKQGQRVD